MRATRPGLRSTVVPVKRLLVPALLLALAACSSSGKSSNGAPTSAPASSAGVTTTTLSKEQVALNDAAAKRVVISSCAPDAAHHLVIKGAIKNATSQRSTFVIQLSINDKSGKRLYATAAMASDVAPNQSGSWTAATTAKYTAGMTCTVSSVSRRLAT